MPLSDNGKPPRDWLEQVFARLESAMVAYTRRQVGGDLEAARDIVQEAFLRLCQEPWPRIEPHVTAWLYRTCRNQAIDLFRREGRMRTVHENSDVSMVEDRNAADPQRDMSDGERLDKLKSKINSLPAKQQEVLRLRIQDGLSYQQISEITGLTTTNVGYHLHQAVTRLRAIVER